jgi:hypothetical protein
MRRVAEAQREAEVSRELLEESRPLTDELRRMRAENHVSRIIEATIRKRDGEGDGDDAV